MKTEQWNKILKDLGWDDPSYGWTKEKVILKRSLEYERTELLEEIKKMEVGESEGWDFFFGSKKQCCPGDDYADVYNKALKDVIRLLNKKDEK